MKKLINNNLIDKKMKKVLVTGSQGFIGTYICNELLSNGYTVVGIDNYSKYGKLNRPHDNHNNFTFYELNVLDPSFHDIVNKEKPNIIILFSFSYLLDYY